MLNFYLYIRIHRRLNLSYLETTFIHPNNTKTERPCLEAHVYALVLELRYIQSDFGINTTLYGLQIGLTMASIFIYAEALRVLGAAFLGLV